MIYCPEVITGCGLAEVDCWPHGRLDSHRGRAVDCDMRRGSRRVDVSMTNDDSYLTATEVEPWAGDCWYAGRLVDR